MDQSKLKSCVRGCAGVLAIATMLGGGSAWAGVAECQADINDLRTELAFFCNGDDTDGKEILGRNPEQTCRSLNSKLDGADEKLDALKLMEALQKLEDFDGKIFQLENASKPKIIGDTAGLDGTEAIGCVQGLIDSL